MMHTLIIGGGANGHGGTRDGGHRLGGACDRTHRGGRDCRYRRA